MQVTTLGKKVAISFQVLVLMFGLGMMSVAVTAAPADAAAKNCKADPNAAGTNPLVSGASCSQGEGQKESLFGKGGIFTVAANTLVFLVGAVSVIYIIIGGLRYVTSNGDTKAVTAAKDTILYAIVGVVVAVISFALVQFVINALDKAKP